VLEKQNIKLFSRLMRRNECNHVHRKLFLVSQMLLLLPNFQIFGVLFLLNGSFSQNSRSDMKLYSYPLY